MALSTGSNHLSLSETAAAAPVPGVLTTDWHLAATAVSRRSAGPGVGPPGTRTAEVPRAPGA
eukprot:144505-Hanusia_phi.AAC.2